MNQKTQKILFCTHYFWIISGQQSGIKRAYSVISSKKSGGVGSKGSNGGPSHRNKKSKVMKSNYITSYQLDCEISWQY